MNDQPTLEDLVAAGNWTRIGRWLAYGVVTKQEVMEACPGFPEGEGQ